MKKYIIIFSVATILVLAASSLALTGAFTKVTTKTFQIDDSIEQNITIRKYFNVTIKFRKFNSTSDLTIKNDNTTIILKDADYNEIKMIVGMDGQSIYSFADKLDLNKIKYVSAFNLNNSAKIYEDVINQEVNISYLGTKATIIVRVNEITEGTATLSGYVNDELTDQFLEGIEILAFTAGDDPNSSSPIVQDTTDTSGKYNLLIPINSSEKTYDIYVKDYSSV